MWIKIAVATNFIARLMAIALLFLIDPIIAVLINTFLDTIDGTIHEYLLKIKNEKYQLIDKLLDYVYYVGLMAAAIHLQLPALWMLGALLVYRTIGQVIFFFQRDRRIFVYFPNFFEVFVLGLLIAEHLKASFFVDLTLPLLFSFMLLKMWQEIFLHRQKRSFTKIFWIPLLKTLHFQFSRIKALAD